MIGIQNEIIATHVTAKFSLDSVGSEKGIVHRIVPGAGVLPPEGWRVD